MGRGAPKLDALYVREACVTEGRARLDDPVKMSLYCEKVLS
jgi:hypothetical protein